MSTDDRSSAVAVGIDLGGTATRFVAMDGLGQVVSQFIEGTPSEGTLESVVRFLVDNIRRVAGERGIASIGIGASGPIDAGGIIRNHDTLPAFSDIDLLEQLAAPLAVQPAIANDAVTAAIGEYRLGAGRGAHDVLMVTLGTGVGVCLLQGGEPFRGSGGQHPEASHISIDGAPAPCHCGRPRCWEQAASRRALQDAASSLVEGPAHTSADIDHALALADSGDDRAHEMFASYGRALAAGLATLISVYAPDRVLIGGSGSNYLRGYGPALREALRKIEGLDVDAVVAAELGEYGGAIGAALFGASDGAVDEVNH